MSMGRSISWPDGHMSTYRYCDSPQTYRDGFGRDIHFHANTLYLVYFHMDLASIQGQWDDISHAAACRKVFWRELWDQGPLAAFRFWWSLP